MSGTGYDAGVSLALNRISSQVAGLTALTGKVAGSVETVNSRVNVIDNRVVQLESNLQEVYTFLQAMRKEAAMAAALQRAITEIIRVRQELERDYGNYKIVRDSMVGVLQATDRALVTESTISRISEELMLTTPRYWLAPVLVAVSAWIGNNQGLAERAIKEAVKRDPEKTALVMALICRRNGRQEACFAWLRMYFSMLDANHMTRSVITYIDAYVSGIFGPDKDNMCGDYISKWMNDLQGCGDDFKNNQIAIWKGYFESFCLPNETKSAYPELAIVSTEFNTIDDCMQAVVAAPKIQDKIDSIMFAKVDEEALKAKIDEQLTTLVTKYDAEESKLRNDEEKLQMIKDLKGDEEEAERRMALILAERKDEPVDLAQRLAANAQSASNENIAAKKTAVFFLKEYIMEGYKQFLEDRKKIFPEVFKLKFSTWQGQYDSSNNSSKVIDSFKQKMNADRQNALDNKKYTAPIVMAIIAAVCLVLGIFTQDVLQILGIGAFIVLAIVAIVKAVSVKKARAEINSQYDSLISNGSNKITKSIAQWEDLTNRFNAGMVENEDLEIRIVKE